jgi:xanthine dehydrogenase YagR molybdenum-binding subunit
MQPAITHLKNRSYKTRGNPEQAFASATVVVDETYTTPVNHHNPIELSGTIAMWEGEQLTIYEPLQWVLIAQRHLATQFNIPQENVRVISHYVGGAFGCKALPWAHVSLAALAARELRRPVKLGLSRAQMYSSVGYRPATVQRMRLAASRDGQLTAILHDTISQTSPTDDYSEAALPVTI